MPRGGFAREISDPSIRDGNVRITGRVKDIIIRNAENISALEVEEVIRRHPAVADVAVIGLPDPRTGERACAVAVLRPGAELDLAGLVEICSPATWPATNVRSSWKSSTPCLGTAWERFESRS